jgi:PPOX class probable F420-dependent enzyme
MNKSKTVDTIQDALTQPGSTHTVFLTSFRRSGQGVGSPVGMAVADGKLYFMTPAATWKARRIANNPQVTLALCTYQGKVLSPAVAGMARRLFGKEARRARALLRVRFIGWMWNIIFSLRYPGDKTAVYEVSLVTGRQTSQAEEASPPMPTLSQFVDEAHLAQGEYPGKSDFVA